MNKIKTNDTWEIKFLRENWTMPFGSMCNLLGQSYQGQEIDTARLEELTSKAFELSLRFTEEAYSRVQKENENKIDVPIKKKK